MCTIYECLFHYRNMVNWRLYDLMHVFVYSRKSRKTFSRKFSAGIKSLYPPVRVAKRMWKAANEATSEQERCRRGVYKLRHVNFTDAVCSYFQAN